MKTITVLLPTYNEEDNVEPMANAVIEQLESIGGYDYHIVFIDNDSKDSTRQKIREMCSKNSKIRAIFNIKNYGQFNSPYYGITQTEGDCCICMSSDFQEPPEMIPKLVKSWEEGHDIVLGQKISSTESIFKYKARGAYYRYMRKHGSHGFLEQVTGFGLYDRSFIELMKKIDDPKPFLRGIIPEIGYNIDIIPFKQQNRRSGKSSNNLKTLYDGAMQSITVYTKFPIRLATFLGLGLSVLSGIGIIGSIICKLFDNNFDLNVWLPMFVITLVVSVQLFFLGLVGEYILDIRDQVRKRPLVIEAERINFKTERNDR